MPIGAWGAPRRDLPLGAGLICARLLVHTWVCSPAREHRALHTWERSPHPHACVSASLCVRAAWVHTWERTPSLYPWVFAPACLSPEAAPSCANTWGRPEVHRCCGQVSQFRRPRRALMGLEPLPRTLRGQVGEPRFALRGEQSRTWNWGRNQGGLLKVLFILSLHRPGLHLGPGSCHLLFLEWIPNWSRCHSTIHAQSPVVHLEGAQWYLRDPVLTFSEAQSWTPASGWGGGRGWGGEWQWGSGEGQTSEKSQCDFTLRQLWEL